MVLRPLKVRFMQRRALPLPGSAQTRTHTHIHTPVPVVPDQPPVSCAGLGVLGEEASGAVSDCTGCVWPTDIENGPPPPPILRCPDETIWRVESRRACGVPSLTPFRFSLLAFKISIKKSFFFKKTYGEIQNSTSTKTSNFFGQCTANHCNPHWKFSWGYNVQPNNIVNDLKLKPINHRIIQ